MKYKNFVLLVLIFCTSEIEANSLKNGAECIPLLLASGSGAQQVLPKELYEMPAGLTPQGQQFFYFLRELRAVQQELIQSYHKLLEVYYDIRVAQGDTSSRVDGTVGEFTYTEYVRYREQLDTHETLKGNMFLSKLKEYKGGRANDIFQRDAYYVLGKFKKEGGPNNLGGFKFDEAITESMEFLSAISRTQDYSLLAARRVFAEVSMAKSYSGNAKMSANPEQKKLSEALNEMLNSQRQAVLSESK